MARKPVQSPVKKSKPIKPNFTHHNHPEPYSRLLTLGKSEPKELYDEIAASLLKGDGANSASYLVGMIKDESYYEYDDDDYDLGTEGDKRGWTRLHALRVLTRMGPAAGIGIEPLLALLNDEDDYISEEIPFYYAAMGKAAIPHLERILDIGENKDNSYRGQAATSLSEIGQEHSELREECVSILERCLAKEEDYVLNGFMVGALMDLGAKESYHIIEQTFKEERVEPFIVQLSDVQQHFGMPVTAPKEEVAGKRKERFEDYEEEEEELFAEQTTEIEAPYIAHLAPTPEIAEPRIPYVAPVKVGRNEPCPCGSGKKYKKCCGAS